MCQFHKQILAFNMRKLALEMPKNANIYLCITLVLTRPVVDQFSGPSEAFGFGNGFVLTTKKIVHLNNRVQ